MWLHFSIFSSLIILGMLYKPKNKTSHWFYFCAVFLIFFVIASFRSVSIGNDTKEYYRVFQLVSSRSTLSDVLGLTRYEVGYMVLNFLITRYTSSFTVLLSFISTFYLFSVLRFVKKYANKTSVVMIMCFTFFIFYDVMNIMRQCISVAIFLFAIDYLIERKFMKYCCLIFLASLFQSVSIILLLVYFLPKTDFKKIKDFVKWILLSGLALIILGSLSKIAGIVFPYFAHYFSSEYAEGGVRGASVVFFLQEF